MKYNLLTLVSENKGAVQFSNTENMLRLTIKKLNHLNQVKILYNFKA